MCPATNIPIIDAYQPLQLIGLLKRDRYNRLISSTLLSDVVIIACVIVMRSMLKRHGLWKQTIAHSVISKVFILILFILIDRLKKRSLKRTSRMISRY